MHAGGDKTAGAGVDPCGADIQVAGGGDHPVVLERAGKGQRGVASGVKAAAAICQLATPQGEVGGGKEAATGVVEEVGAEMGGTRGGFELPGGVGEAGGAKGETVVAGNEPAGVVQQAGDADGELGALRGNDAASPVVEGGCIEGEVGIADDLPAAVGEFVVYLQVYGAGAATDEGAAAVVEAGGAQVEVVGAQIGVAAVEVAADLRLQLSVGHEAGCVGVEQVGAEGEVAGTGCAAGEVETACGDAERARGKVLAVGGEG